MNHKRWIIGLSLLSLLTVRAQDFKDFKNELDVSVGYSLGSIKDLNFAPLNYRENGINYGIGYTRKLETGNLFSMRFDYADAEIETDASDFLTSDYTSGNARISYLIDVGSISNKLHFFLGGEYQTNWNKIEFQAFGVPKDSYLVAHSLNIAALLAYSLNERNSLFFKAALPLVSFTVRPPFSEFDEEFDSFRLFDGGELGSFNKYVAFDGYFLYQYTLLQNVNLNASYTFLYQKHSEENEFTRFNSRLNIGVSLKF